MKYHKMVIEKYFQTCIHDVLSKKVYPYINNDQSQLLINAMRELLYQDTEKLHTYLCNNNPYNYYKRIINDLRIKDTEISAKIDIKVYYTFTRCLQNINRNKINFNETCNIFYYYILYDMYDFCKAEQRRLGKDYILRKYLESCQGRFGLTPEEGGFDPIPEDITVNNIQELSVKRRANSI